MEEKILTSDFLNRATEVCKEITEMIEKATDGKNRGIVILAAEQVNGSSSMNVIGVAGNGKEVFSALHDFATQPQTAGLFRAVSSKVAIETILKHQ